MWLTDHSRDPGSFDDYLFSYSVKFFGPIVRRLRSASDVFRSLSVSHEHFSSSVIRNGMSRNIKLMLIVYSDEVIRFPAAGGKHHSLIFIIIIIIIIIHFYYLTSSLPWCPPSSSAVWRSDLIEKFLFCGSVRVGESQRLASVRS